MGLRKQLTSTAELKFPTANFHTNILTHYGPDEYISLLVELWMLKGLSRDNLSYFEHRQNYR